MQRSVGKLIMAGSQCENPLNSTLVTQAPSTPPPCATTCSSFSTKKPPPSNQVMPLSSIYENFLSSINSCNQLLFRISSFCLLDDCLERLHGLALPSGPSFDIYCFQVCKSKTVWTFSFHVLALIRARIFWMATLINFHSLLKHFDLAYS